MYMHVYLPEFAHMIGSRASSLLFYFLGKTTFTYLFFNLLQSDFALLFYSTNTGFSKVRELLNINSNDL